MRLIAALILIPLVVGGCANQGLRDLRNNSGGPDEFIVAPVGALEQPQDYATLPTPTPGQANRTDRYPLQEGIVAVGGNPAAASGPIPASDGALVQHASRLGVTPGIRQTLAESDADFRRRKARFTQFRIVNVDRYNQAYKRQALDPDFVADQWRARGADTPSYPPAD
ncbi:DUF3035 domain-containing protein [Sulfitobacter sabulilitoris]|uniref:DUF3035 domain-containing protein n=1 Tax=Sulfitobacter sabulilitoris TaxID=2562655 RepID=A0A5S3PEA4_9RHOB|nr:DUF3035 domain-containing protein [Sulfitobacter sabulilitoris]TMM52348.1 DUF3035 domain-containing protein [Sulfitobacter sabulilitoris]